MNKWEIRKQNEQHPWRVGDLCTAVYDNVGEGLIYRVIEVNGGQLKVRPTFGVIASTSGRKTRTMGKGWCKPLSLVDLATAYTKFGLFIAQEAKHRAEQETDTEEVPAGDSDDDEGRQDDADGGGLCADISARDEGETHD